MFETLAPMPTCRATIDPPCDRPATKGELCAAHYEQERRARAAGKRVTFTPLRTSPGEGRQLTVRFDATLLEAIELAAADDGEEIREWIRGACRERLQRSRKGA